MDGMVRFPAFNSPQRPTRWVPYLAAARWAVSKILEMVSCDAKEQDPEASRSKDLAQRFHRSILGAVVQGRALCLPAFRSVARLQA